MQQIMQWVKGHLIEVICGAVGLVAITFIVLGILLSDVNAALATDAQLISSLSGIKPVNKAMIDAANARKSKTVEQTTAALKKVAEIGKHAPLLEKLFPEPATGSENLPFRFAYEFAKAHKAMVEQLKAKDAPTQEEVRELAENMATEQAQKNNQQAIGARGEAPLPMEMGPIGAGRRGPGPGLGLGGPPPRGGPGFGGPRADLTQLRPNMTAEEMVNEIPDCRAAVQRARSIYCYASDKTSFDQRPAVENVQKPSIEDMWYAQVSLWIQQDVVTALAGLNNRVAAAITARNQEAPYVGNLPVKHLQRFVVTGYLPPSAGAGGGGASPPGGTRGALVGGGGMGPGEAFTNTGSSDTMDVVHFTVELVVEARMLPSVIDEICKVGFYTLLLVNLQEQPPSPVPAGYIYGPSPTVQARLVFEGGFLRDNYANLIPKKVVADIASGVAFQGGGGQGGGGGPSYGPPMGPRNLPPMMMGPEGAPPPRRGPLGRPEGM
ncbi:MAG TPA: hypothetical protein PKY77_22855 [Phycisphaerae bacterium]|nr:hypothetical protein [Phycisphaerae bacterium]HRY68433.1 hypothetical protein [Phycisphaerae bacterium]HSA28532.1 hypothetical protein [Phycisphaerae bacterium]